MKYWTHFYDVNSLFYENTLFVHVGTDKLFLDDTRSGNYRKLNRIEIKCIKARLKSQVICGNICY